MRAAYLDASAAVKLFKHEPETAALVEALGQWPVLVSSELLTVEARCTARRLDDPATSERVDAVLARIDLVRFTQEIRELAGGIAFQPALPALDAIHVATAITVSEELGAIFAYDANLKAAADAQGLEVRAPTHATSQ